MYDSDPEDVAQEATAAEPRAFDQETVAVRPMDIPIRECFQPPKESELGQSSGAPASLVEDGANPCLLVSPSSSVPSKAKARANETVLQGPSYLGSLIQSLGEGLKGNPLKAISKLIPDNFTRGAGRTIPERFVDMIVHRHFTVSFFLFSSQIFFLSHFLFYVS